MALRDVARFEFIIRDAPWSFSKEVYLVERVEGATYLITMEKVEGGDVLIKRNEVPKDHAIVTPPLFRVSHDMAPALFQALAAALEKDVRLPKPTEDRLAGNLEAVREHLKDMRSLVFDYGLKGGSNGSGSERPATAADTEGKK